MHWNFLSSAQPTSTEEVVEILLTNRGITDQKNFFQPPRPESFTLQQIGIDEQQVEVALNRLEKAIANKEEIVVFGDYDADGVCATAVLWEMLSAVGCQVWPFIPHREKHGYGMSERSLQALLSERKPSLVITVDNGIVAHSAVDVLKSKGIDVIITDHHQPEESLPAADAVIHTTQLCGTTVAWMVARAIAQRFPDLLQTKPESLDLCAIATIADQVPLVGANRSFTKYGLEALPITTRPGVQALLKQASSYQSKDSKTINTTQVSFGLAPRINAMGRLDHSLDALRLLCTKSAERADELAQKLGDMNTRRQELTTDMIEDAKAQAAAWPDERIIVVASESYHDGVIGLIAGKLTEQFYKPSIVISITDGMAKASARSLPGVNIIDLIRQAREHLLELGGHPMAAGFSLETSKIEVAQQHLFQLARELITPEQLLPNIPVEMSVLLSLVSTKLCQTLATLEPYGAGNPEPIMAVENVKLLDAFTMGQEGKHLKLVVGDQDGQTLNCIAWGKGEWLPTLTLGQNLSLAGIPELNYWKDKCTVQMRVKDLKTQLPN